MSALATLLIAALSKDHTDAVDVLERRSAFQMHFFIRRASRAAAGALRAAPRSLVSETASAAWEKKKWRAAIAFGSLAHRCVIQPIQRYRTRNSDRPSC